MEIEEAILNILGKVDRQQQTIDTLLQLMQKEEETKPIVFSYPNDGTYASVDTGKIELDFGVGQINTIGTITKMLHSLDSEGKDTIKSFFIDVDKPVKLQFDDSPDTYLVRPGRHRANHLNFRKLEIITVESTNIMVLASTDPKALFEFEEQSRQMVYGSKVDTAGTSDYFETDQEIGDTPTLYIQMYPTTIKKFKINSIRYYMDCTNAVTYELYLLEQASADDVQNLVDVVFDSGALKADVTSYMNIEGDASGKLPIIVNLADAGKLYYQLDWSAAPGDTKGYIVVKGEKLL